MATRQQIINEARLWLGTPYRHQGRLINVACDCVGLIIGVARAVGLVAPDFDVTGYPRTPDPFLMRRLLKANLDEIDKNSAIPGDVVWMRSGKDPQHLGILVAKDRMIHAVTGDEVRGMRLDGKWKPKIVRAYRYRGLEDDQIGLFADG